MRFVAKAAFAFIVTLALSWQVYADVPAIITHQGRLTTPTGDPVPDGTYSMLFRIYPAASDVEPVWASGTRSVEVQNGMFTYLLGDSVAIPMSVFTNYSTLYLGVSVDGSEMEPFTRLTSSPFALRAGKVEWTGIMNMPDGFADGVDNEGSGDITEVIATEGLDGGGSSGSVTLLIAEEGVTGNHIENETITDADISASASIQPTKIAGTVATLDADQTFTGGNMFASTVRIADSIWLKPAVVTQGSQLARFGTRDLPVYTSGTVVISTTPGLNNSYPEFSGIYCDVTTADEFAYLAGIQGVSNTTNSNVGTFGILGQAIGGSQAIGVYGYASFGTQFNWAGYFYGDVSINGNLVGGKNGTQIDHPLDPENKFLEQANMESPEMLSFHNGNVTTDADGFASVTLPEWFEAANRDFRYQLTVIGDFAQAIVAEKIRDNHFTIRTDKPNVEVSWQVTGVRNDPWAQANPVQVEHAKPGPFRGLYRHPEAYGLPESRAIESVHRNKESSQ